MNDREFLRHTLATLAYRAAKATRGAPASFASFQPGPTTRTAAEIRTDAVAIRSARRRLSSGYPSAANRWASRCS